jgi:hypothetical protein
MRSIHSLFLVSLLFGAACTSDDPNTGSTSQSVTAFNKLSSNKLSSNKLSSNKLSSNKLSSNKLSSNKLVLNKAGAEDLLSTADGRDVLSYIVSCAIDGDMTLVAPTSDSCSTVTDCLPDPTVPFSATCDSNKCTYDFPGGLGLTPHWIDHELDEDGKGWISACLFARVNAHDTAEEISLRGPNRALTVSADEATLYDVEEGAFYGNLFTPGNDPPNWIACEGEGQASGEFGGLVDRDCTEPDPANPGFTQCGFIYAGFCGDYTPAVPNPQACDEFSSNGYYEDCHSTASLLTHHGHDHEHGDRGGYDDGDGHDGDDHGHDGDDHGHDGCHQHGEITYQQVITTFVTD